MCHEKTVLQALVMKTQKQKKLTQDYADFLADHEKARVQGVALGTFLEWVHKNNRAGVVLTKRGDK